MGSWLFGQKSSVTAAQPSSGLRIQTSQQGVVKPIVWGQTRIAGNIIWYGDFFSVAVQNPQSGGGKGGSAGGGGKGQQGGNSYEYFVSVAIGLCEGPIADVTGCWNNKSHDTAAHFGFSKFLGGYSQTAWGYLASLHPSQALNYRGLSYAAAQGFALGQNDALPQLGWEVLSIIANAIPGNTSADPKDVTVDFLTNSKYGVGFPAARLDTALTSYSAYCRALGLVVSPALVEQKEASAFLNDLFAATNSSPRWSGGILSVVPWGDTAITANGVTYTPNVTPLYDITEDDLLPNEGSAGSGQGTSGAPIIAVRKRKSDMLNSIKVEFLDRTNNYDPNAAVEAKDQASIDVFGLRSSELKQLHFFCDAAAAQMSASLMLGREQIPNTYTFTLGPKFILVDVEDLLTLTRPTMGLARQAVRVTEIQENASGTLTFTAEEFLGTASAPLYGTQAPGGFVNNTNVDPGIVNPPFVFEPTDQLGGGLEIWGAVSGVNTSLWGGCQVWASYDDITYQFIGTIRGPARMGVLTAPLASVTPAPSGPTIDTTNTLAVDLTESAGTLLSAGNADFTAFNTRCVVDNEIIAYQTATLTAANKYSLTTLNRGGYGSTIASHAVGAPFARLDQGIFQFEYDQSRIGSKVYFKFLSFNLWGGGLQSLASVSSYNYTITGAALASPLPNVQNLTTKFVDGRLNIAWDEIKDFRSGILYEIRKGSTFDGALTYGTQAHPPFTVHSGDGTYWVTAQCQPSPGLLVRSASPQSIAIAGSALADNIIASYDLKALGWPGVFTNTGVDGGLNAVRTAGAGSVLAESNVLTDPDILNLGGNTSGIYDPGIIVDIGRPAPCPVTVTWIGTGAPVGQNILGVLNILAMDDFLGAASAAFVDVYPEIAVAQSNAGNILSDPNVLTDPNVLQFGIPFGPWQKYTPGVYVGQVFKIRFRLNTIDPNTIAYLLSASFAVDVPDRVDNALVNGTLPAGGMNIVFTPNGSTTPAPFNGGPNSTSGAPTSSGLPAVTVSWSGPDKDPADMEQVTNLTTSGCTVQILNGGVGVQRSQVNIFVEGW